MLYNVGLKSLHKSLIKEKLKHINLKSLSLTGVSNMSHKLTEPKKDTASSHQGYLNVPQTSHLIFYTRR